MTWPLVALKAQHGEANYWICKNSKCWHCHNVKKKAKKWKNTHITWQLSSVTSITNYDNISSWEIAELDLHFTRCHSGRGTRTKNFHAADAPATEKMALMRVTWRSRGWKSAQWYLHPCTAKPIAQATGRKNKWKEERKHNSIKECHQKKKSCIQIFKVSLNRTCRKNRMI